VNRNDQAVISSCIVDPELPNLLTNALKYQPLTMANCFPKSYSLPPGVKSRYSKTTKAFPPLLIVYSPNVTGCGTFTVFESDNALTPRDKVG
jgi:hypothetical protein